MMIEFGRFPAIGGVTLATASPRKSTFEQLSMRTIVALFAFMSFQPPMDSGFSRTVIVVTVAASHGSVSALEGKGGLVVEVEVE